MTVIQTSIYDAFYESFDIACLEFPDTIVYGEQHICFFWKVKHDQDSVYEMFKSKNLMMFYFDYLCRIFHGIYPEYTFDTKYSYHPVEYNDSMYSRVIIYYYPTVYEIQNPYFAC